MFLLDIQFKKSKFGIFRSWFSVDVWYLFKHLRYILLIYSYYWWGFVTRKDSLVHYLLWLNKWCFLIWTSRIITCTCIINSRSNYCSRQSKQGFNSWPDASHNWATWTHSIWRTIWQLQLNVHLYVIGISCCTGDYIIMMSVYWHIRWAARKLIKLVCKPFVISMYNNIWLGNIHLT